MVNIGIYTTRIDRGFKYEIIHNLELTYFVRSLNHKLIYNLK